MVGKAFLVLIYDEINFLDVDPTPTRNDNLGSQGADQVWHGWEGRAQPDEVVELQRLHGPKPKTEKSRPHNASGLALVKTEDVFL